MSPRILITGAAGFVGQNLNLFLSSLGFLNITLVDKFDHNHKLISLSKTSFLDIKCASHFNVNEYDFDIVIHQGAISSTTEENTQLLYETNINFSNDLASYCNLRGIPFIYASSASVYGESGDRVADARSELLPLNGYAASKLIFDKIIESKYPELKYFGLRYFNVYGPYELHKTSMASPVTKFYLEAANTGTIRLFEEPSTEPSTHHSRDFIFVQDICALVLHLIQRHDDLNSKIFDVGSGEVVSFRQIANLVSSKFSHSIRIVDIPFPEKLREHYQSLTRANVQDMRSIGFDKPMTSITEGVARTIEWLAKNKKI